MMMIIILWNGKNGYFCWFLFRKNKQIWDENVDKLIEFLNECIIVFKRTKTIKSIRTLYKKKLETQIKIKIVKF